jgi:hypothetical protein
VVNDDGLFFFVHTFYANIVLGENIQQAQLLARGARKNSYGYVKLMVQQIKHSAFNTGLKMSPLRYTPTWPATSKAVSKNDKPTVSDTILVVSRRIFHL